MTNRLDLLWNHIPPEKARPEPLTKTMIDLGIYRHQPRQKGQPNSVAWYWIPPVVVENFLDLNTYDPEWMSGEACKNIGRCTALCCPALRCATLRCPALRCAALPRAVAWARHCQRCRDSRGRPR